MASTGSGLSFLTTNARPSTWLRSFAATTLSGATSSRWFGITCASLRNQKFDMAVSSRPLPGTGEGRMTSNADRRSVWMMSMRAASIS